LQTIPVDHDILMMLDAALSQELDADQVLISERVFIRVAEQFFKVPNFAESKLFDSIK
jgi:hypothetical protein